MPNNRQATTEAGVEAEGYGVLHKAVHLDYPYINHGQALSILLLPACSPIRCICPFRQGLHGSLRVFLTPLPQHTATAQPSARWIIIPSMYHRTIRILRSSAVQHNVPVCLDVPISTWYALRFIHPEGSASQNLPTARQTVDAPSRKASELSRALVGIGLCARRFLSG